MDPMLPTGCDSEPAARSVIGRRGRCHDERRPLHQRRSDGVTMSDTEICTVEELRAIYRKPGRGAVDKEHTSITDHDRAFIAHATLVMLATSDADGRCDVSSKGGTPGFVAVLDDGRVAVPALSGNNRLDTHQNLLVNPH